jgi:hypothetical protein
MEEVVAMVVKTRIVYVNSYEIGQEVRQGQGSGIRKMTN